MSEAQIIKIDNPFRRSRKEIIPAQAGETVEVAVSRIVKDDTRFDCEYVTAINGIIIEKGSRAGRILKKDEFLLIVPMVAGGGGDGKSILNAVALIALFAVGGPLANQLAVGFGVASATGYALFYVATVVGGGMLINSLQPHPKRPSSGFPDEEQSQSFGWNPASVQRQGISVPRFYGLNKMFGNVISAYTEKEADTFQMTTIAEAVYYDQHGERTFRYARYAKYVGTTTTTTGSLFDPRKVNLYALFNLGMGPMREPVVQDSLELNDQPIANLSSVFFEERVGDINQSRISYFDKTRLEVLPGGAGRLVVNGSPVIYTTSNGNFNDLEIELAFPRGLYDATGGDFANNTVNVTVEIKKTTSSTWTLLADGVNIIDGVGDKVIETYTTVATFAVEFGTNYDVRVTKNTAERDNIKYGDDLFLDKVREIIDRQFIYPRRALVGIKALATDQLSGSIRFSCLSRGLYVRKYSDSLAIGYSNNPADVIADILTQPVYSGAHSPWNDLTLMLNFEGADAATTMVDDSPKGHEATFGGGAELDTAIQKFGSASGLLDGVDSFWSFTNDGSSFGIFNNLVEDWTLDLFLAFGDHVGAEMIFGQWLDADNRIHLEHLHGTGFSLVVRINTSVIISIVGVGEIADNDLHHIAICKVGDKIGLYKDDVQIGYALISSVVGNILDSADFYIGQTGNSTFYLFGNYDHFRIQKYNVFSAAPNVGLTDTITEPVAAYTDPGNSYAVARYDGYDPSKLLTADFEDLADWCDDAEVNPVNFTISSISQAVNAVVITNSKHNFKVGDVVLFRDVDDFEMVEIPDGTTATVINVTSDTIFTIDLDTSGYTPFVALHWLEVDSSTIDSVCGETGGKTLAMMLDGGGSGEFWQHTDNETHEFVLDLGQDYNVIKVRGRSNSSDDPIDVDVFVSQTNGVWGAAVAATIATWQDTSIWQEVDTTDKIARYVKVEVLDTEDALKVLVWNGAGPGRGGFDVGIGQSTATVERYQPRFAFNGGFDTETNMWGAALRVCELCRCIPFWDGDIIRIAIDKSGSSVYAFTMGNIVKDSFKQRFIPTAERASEIEVHYRDASQDYIRQPFTLVNDSIGNVSNKVRLDLFGITDTDMANRIADFKLLQNLNIKKFVVFTAEIDAIACTLGDIVDIQHDVTNWGMIGSGDDPFTGGGRVIFATNITNAVITIEGDIYFDDADFAGGSTAYKLLLKTADDAAPESKSITGVTESSITGGTFDITVSGVFAAEPGRDDIWAAGVAAFETNKYRIVNMRQTSEQRIEITGVEYNTAIYAND